MCLPLLVTHARQRWFIPKMRPSIAFWITCVHSWRKHSLSSERFRAVSGSACICNLNISHKFCKGFKSDDSDGQFIRNHFLCVQIWPIQNNDRSSVWYHLNSVLKDLYHSKLFTDAYMNVRSNITNSYDFGFSWRPCMELKQLKLGSRSLQMHITICTMLFILEFLFLSDLQKFLM